MQLNRMKEKCWTFIRFYSQIDKEKIEEQETKLNIEKTMRKQEGTICINRTNKNECMKNSIETNAASHKEKNVKGKDTRNLVFQWKIQLSNDFSPRWKTARY